MTAKRSTGYLTTVQTLTAQTFNGSTKALILLVVRWIIPYTYSTTSASGDIDLFDHLVSRGADTSLCTALHSASQYTDTEMSRAMVCYLLDKHNMDINGNNDDLRHFWHDSQDSGSPICSAILHKNLAVVHELLKRGARVNCPDWYPVSYAVRAGGFFSALELLLHAGADTNKALKISVLRRNIDAAKTCLRFGADPAPALHEAIAQEEYRTSTIAENAAYLESRPEFSYKKSESTFEKEMVEERESQAMVALLRNAMG
jgi:ankyrin repeat protein